MHQVARAFAAVGDERRAAGKWRDDGSDTLAWRAKLLTHDADRYADEIWWRRQRPDLVMGPGSWRWLERAYASMRALALFRGGKPFVQGDLLGPLTCVHRDGCGSDRGRKTVGRHHLAGQPCQPAQIFGDAAAQVSRLD